MGEHGLPPADHSGRRSALRGRLAEHGVEVLLVTHLVNVRYLTGFTGSNGAVLIGPDDEHSVLLTDGRYETQAAEQVPDLGHSIGRGSLAERALEHAPAGRVALEHPTPGTVAVEHAPVGRVAREQAGAGVVAFEQDHLSFAAGTSLHDVAQEHGLTLTGVSGHVEALRTVKDDHELAALTRACELSDQAFVALVEWLRPGVTELEVARFLDRTGEDLGSDGPSFETIAASGPNGGMPHHRPGGRRLERGDLLTVDFGALVAGYHADTTRTIALGDPDPELVRIHDVVRAAQSAGRAAATAGTTVGEVDAAARTVIEEAGYGQRFVHPTGHALGLEIHEQPIVVGEGTATLRPCVAITVEPGIYLPGVGGVRIEDTVVVVDDGPSRSLTESPRELLRL